MKLTSNSKISVQVIKPRLLSLALFYLVIDVWMYKKWTLFFRVIGMNSILIYLIVVGGLINVSSTSMSLFGWIARPLVKMEII